MQPPAIHRSVDRRKDALYASRSALEIRFDPETQLLRRNLLFVSLLAFASIMVTPKNGSYNVNLGIINGEISPIWIVHAGLFCVCCYQVVHFWVSCRSQLLNSKNFAGMRESFFGVLAALIGQDSWYELVKANAKDGKNSGIINFENWLEKDALYDIYKSRSQIEAYRFDKMAELKEAILADDRFEVQRYGDVYTIIFSYQTTPEDYVYLEAYSNYYWVWKGKLFLENLLPLLLGGIALIALLIKIIVLVLQHP